MKRLAIALQKNGRLTQESVQLLTRCGLDLGFSSRSRKLISPCKNYPIDVFYLRSKDIVKFLLMGKSDVAFVGENTLMEDFEQEVENGQLEILGELPFGACRLSLAFAPDKFPKDIEDMNGMRIATSYPNILKKELEKYNVEVFPVDLEGSIEIAPSLGLCDGIFDIVSTGSTLKAHGLVEYKKLYESKVVIVCNSELKQTDLWPKAVLLKERIEASLKADQSKYIMMNAPAAKVDQITEVLPGLESPSVIQLSTDQTKVAIHAVIKEQGIWEKIEELKTLGASSILVMPIERML